MKQYLELSKRIVEEGVWIANKRTGKRCLTIINSDLSYNVGGNEFPIITTRKSYWKAAIAELLGYLRGYDNAADFRKLGTKSWDANANENSVWLANPARKGVDDMGRVYGVQGRAWLKSDGTPLDQLQKIVDDLSQGIDDRGEILTFYNRNEFRNDFTARRRRRAWDPIAPKKRGPRSDLLRSLRRRPELFRR